jgi:TolB protein
VYVCQLFKDTNRDQICIMNADGSEFRRLTTNDNADYNYPSLSPDGRSVIYSGNDTGQFEIYEMDLESGSARQLTSELGASLSPEISPDGQSILFSVRADDHNSVWIMGRDGSNPHQIYGPPLADGWDPVWSPDGRFVLFASNWTGGIQLYIIQPDGQNLQQVTSMDGLSGRSAWSPDGITIATYSGPEWNHELLLMETDGANARQITHGGNNLAPSFSPDGRWIVFTSYRDRMQDDNGCEIYIMRTDGSQLTRLTDNEYCDWQPRWGP